MDDNSVRTYRKTIFTIIHLGSISRTPNEGIRFNIVSEGESLSCTTVAAFKNVKTGIAIKIREDPLLNSLSSKISCERSANFWRGEHSGDSLLRLN